MKKNKLYLPLVLLIAIILFATAALCNQCAAGNLDELKTDVGEDTSTVEEAVDDEEVSQAEDEEAEEEEAQEEESTEEEEEEEQTQSAYEEPAIELKVYEGPLYSQADDVCYWRVKAVVTGVPTPVVEFNRDDSNGAWGSRKAQINLANPTDSYSLSATATNSEGVATDSIVLTWECNRHPEITEITFMGSHFTGIEYTFSAVANDPDGDTLSYSWSVTGGFLDTTSGNSVKWTMPGTAGDYPVTVEVDDGNGGTDSRTETVEVTDPPLLSMDIPIISGEGGYIGNICWIRAYHMVGDTNTNKAIKGFVSFDISGLGGAEIVSAELTCNSNMTEGNPSGFTPLWISSVYWAPGGIKDGDFNLVGDPIGYVNTASFILDSSNYPKLKHYLQNAVNSGKDRFQIMMFFTGMATDNDNSFDYWYYHDDYITLHITYTP